MLLREKDLWNEIDQINCNCVKPSLPQAISYRLLIVSPFCGW